MITEKRKKELKIFALGLYKLEKQWQKNKNDKDLEGRIMSKVMELKNFEEMDFVDYYITTVLTK